MEKEYRTERGKENHVIAAIVDEEHVVTTLERIEASYGAAYMVLDVPMSGENAGMRFIRAFAYCAEHVQGSFYRITGMTVPMEEIKA